MLLKRVLLTIAAIFIIVLFLNTESYSKWFTTKVWAQKDQLDDHLEHMSIKERMEYRFTKQYLASEKMAEMVQQAKTKNPLILFPPNAYLKAKNFDFPVPEPAVFYYFTGLHSVWTNSPNVQDANWSLELDNGNMQFRPIQSKQQLQDLLNQYKDYEATL